MSEVRSGSGREVGDCILEFHMHKCITELLDLNVAPVSGYRKLKYNKEKQQKEVQQAV